MPLEREMSILAYMFRHVCACQRQLEVGVVEECDVVVALFVLSF